ncbi:LPXTG cell wall anchor domain-containing protein, partial [Faecalibaculum rodentium]
NNKGGSLPETGGMGTTLIYGAGALMAAGAAVVYVTNKRTRKD